jgi:hypothetical protein
MTLIGEGELFSVPKRFNPDENNLVQNVRRLGRSSDAVFEAEKANLTSLMAMPSGSRTVVLDLACAHHLKPAVPF